MTGALGHIGSRVIRNLPLAFPESRITMIDNLMTNRVSSLFNLPKAGQYNFIEADVANMDLNDQFSKADTVIHLAAITDATKSIESPKATELNNFNATKSVAEACIHNDVNLISLSSTSVYGTQKEIVDENCSEKELQPQSPYAETKLKEENLLKKYRNEHGLKYVSCRFGTIYGTSPGMRFHTAVNKFCWQACNNNPITVWKTAYDQKRPYLELEDATRALIFIIKNNLFNGSLYNILSQNKTVREIVEIIRVYKPSLTIEMVEHKIMNQLSYDVSCEKFKSTGFVFKGELEVGIENTIKLLNKIHF